MASETVPYGRVTQKPSPVAEVHILWITAGLGCDGDSVSVTAATQPSIEDSLGSDPWTTQGALAQSRPSIRSRRRLHEILVHGGKGSARSFRPGG